VRSSPKPLGPACPATARDECCIPSFWSFLKIGHRRQSYSSERCNCIAVLKLFKYHDSGMSGVTERNTWGGWALGSADLKATNCISVSLSLTFCVVRLGGRHRDILTPRPGHLYWRLLQLYRTRGKDINSNALRYLVLAFHWYYVCN